MMPRRIEDAIDGQSVIMYGQRPRARKLIIIASGVALVDAQLHQSIICQIGQAQAPGHRGDGRIVRCQLPSGHDEMRRGQRLKRRCYYFDHAAIEARAKVADAERAVRRVKAKDGAAPKIGGVGERSAREAIQLRPGVYLK